MPKTFHIREATKADLEGILPLANELEAYHRANKPKLFKKPSPEKMRERMEKYLSGNAATFVAEAGNKIVGFVQVDIYNVPEDDFHLAHSRGMVNAVQVDGKQKRSGIGSALMKAAEDWLRAKGIAECRLAVWQFNEAARGMYEKMGYEPDLLVLSLPIC